MTRTPDSDYDHCEECGTDAGEPCYDSQDRPCAPCLGRVLASKGGPLELAVARPSPPPPPETRCHCGRPRRGRGDTCGRRVCHATEAK